MHILPNSPKPPQIPSNLSPQPRQQLSAMPQVSIFPIHFCLLWSGASSGDFWEHPQPPAPLPGLSPPAPLLPSHPHQVWPIFPEV